MANVNVISKNVQSIQLSNLEQALSVAGLGWYNIKYCIVLTLFLISAILDPVGYSYVLPASKCDLGITDAQRGFIGSIPYIGIIVTSFLWGYLVDTQGRKLVLIYSSLGTGGLGILSAFMPNYVTFTICKFLASFCIGCAAAAPYTFIGEILPQKYRDITLSIVTALQMLGSALVPLLAWIILPLNFRIDFGAYEFRSWRLLTIAYSSSFVISALLLTCGPESPKYLVSQGRHDDAMKVLRSLYAGNKRKSPEDFPIKSLVMPDERAKVNFFKSLKVQSIPLLKPPYLKWMCLNGFILFGIYATLNGLVLWAPDVVNQVLTGGTGGKTACEVLSQINNETDIDDEECNDTIDTSTFLINTTANVACSLITLAMSATINIIGKKALLIIVLFEVGIFAFLINIVTHEIVYSALLSSFPSVALAIGPVNAYAVEIFPTALRGMAISLTMMVGRVGSVVGINAAGLMINTVCEATFYSFGALMFLCGLLSFLLPKSKKTPKKKESRSVTKL